MNLDLQILGSQAVDPAEWDRFILASPQGCLYALHGYASVVASGWQAMVVLQDGQWMAVMPIAPKRKWGIDYLPHPVFCQYWGIFFAPFPKEKGFQEYRIKHAVVEAVAAALSKYKKVTQNFAPEFDYPLPFSWKGFRLETRYTYHLDLIPEVEELFLRTAPALRRQVKKARKQGLKVSRLLHPEALWELIELNLSKGNPVMGNIANWQEVLQKIWTELRETEREMSWQVQNEAGEVMAAAIYARFGDKQLYLTGAQHPGSNVSGAMDFLMWEAICRAREAGCRLFDFEGSMIEGVERFFRKFGAHPVPYLQIVKNELPLVPRWIRE